MWITLFTTLNIINLVLSKSNTFEINQNKFLGDLCRLSNGLSGTCVEATECKTIKNKSNLILTRCEFEVNSLIICCPEKPYAFTSSKFHNMMCENVEPEIKVIPNIVGGKLAEHGEFPHQVVLGYLINEKIEFNCGGSLVANDLVLTAAHCVNKKNLQPVIVRLGIVSSFFNIKQ